METQNLEWLIFNALHGDVSGDIPEDLQVMIKAEQEFHALRARMARLEEAMKKILVADDALYDAQQNGDASDEYEIRAKAYASARAEVDKLLEEGE